MKSRDLGWNVGFNFVTSLSLCNPITEPLLLERLIQND